MKERTKNKLKNLLYFIIAGVIIILIAKFIPLHTCCIIYISATVLGIIIYMILNKLEFLKAKNIVFDIIMELFIVLYIISMQFNYLNGEGFFYAVSGIISAILIVFYTLIKSNKDSGIGAKIVIALILSFFVFLGTLGFIKTVNYAFDFEEPERFEVTIVDKDYTRYRKAPDIYKFKIELNGNEYWIKVFNNVYNRYDVGDVFLIDKYDGVFNKDFFIA